MIELTAPLQKQDIKRLKVGDVVYLSGKIITARDRAYKRVVTGHRIPVDLRGWAVYHCGPLAIRKNKEWKVISAGPTTSARLDPVQLEFIKRTGVRALIGKGGVRNTAAEGMRKLGCVYLAFPGGAGVVAAKAIKRVESVWWRDLGDTEALWVLRMQHFGPLIVGIDLHGGDLFSLKQRKT